MSDRSKVDDVASGMPYVVTSVNEQIPTDLGDFLSASVAVVSIESGQQVVVIHGPARRDGESIIVYEKDNGGTGKDVRTWRIGEVGGRFEAVERSLY